MRVLSIPLGLLSVTASIFVSAPLLAALQVVLVARAPWWRLPYSHMAGSAAVVFLVLLPLLTLLHRGERWCLEALKVFIGSWVALSAGVAIRLAQPGLGFFALGLSFYWVVAWTWLSREMSRSFFDPRVRWFEGVPKAIPLLKCSALGAEFRVARLDEDGVFLCGARDGQSSSWRSAVEKNRRVDFTLEFRDRSVKCQGVPVCAYSFAEGRDGMGFQFKNSDLDVRKELSDFLERLRGEGYV